jgi:hypothetical protein
VRQRIARRHGHIEPVYNTAAALETAYYCPTVPAYQAGTQ